MADCGRGSPDLIVEVAHPDITRQHGAAFLAVADFMIGSPTALADRETEAALAAAADRRGLYVPSGALWGGEDIRRMAERGSLRSLTVTMSGMCDRTAFDTFYHMDNDEIGLVNLLYNSKLCIIIG